MQFMCLFSFRFYVFNSLPFFPPILFSDFPTLLVLQLCLPPFFFQETFHSSGRSELIYIYMVQRQPKCVWHKLSVKKIIFMWFVRT
jgi:hypothetical protein